MSTFPPTPPPRAGHFTPFASAADEAAMKLGQDESGNQAGRMRATAGRLVRTPGSSLPYKVVLSHRGGAQTERGFATVREAEAFIRRNTPAPPARSTLYDRDARGIPK